MQNGKLIMLFLQLENEDEFKKWKINVKSN